MAGKYWEEEVPEAVEGKFVTFKYYREAGRLQIIRRILTQHGEKLRTVTLSRKDFKDDQTRRFFLDLLTDWEKQKESDHHA